MLFALPLYPEEIIITSDYFSGDTELLQFIKENINNKKDLQNKINKYLYFKGYYFSSVRKIIHAGKEKTLIFVTEGRIENFRIAGNRKISDKIIKIYLYFKKYDVFNKKKLRLQIKKLYNTGLFDSIKYNIDKSTKSINIEIIEKKRKYFKLSGNYTEQYGFMPYLGFINRHLFNSEGKIEENRIDLNVGREKQEHKLITLKNETSEYFIKTFKQARKIYKIRDVIVVSVFCGFRIPSCNFLWKNGAI